LFRRIIYWIPGKCRFEPYEVLLYNIYHEFPAKYRFGPSEVIPCNISSAFSMQPDQNTLNACKLTTRTRNGIWKSATGNGSLDWNQPPEVH
jgi:hypothetical protein